MTVVVAIGDIIQRYPLLRLLVPYVCGIGVADLFYPYARLLLYWGIGCVVFVAFVLLVICVCHRGMGRVVYGMAMVVLFCILGMGGYSLARYGTAYDWPQENVLYEARVMAEPHSRARSTKCVVEVTAMCDSAEWHRVGRKVFAYMEPCSEADSLLPGDMLYFRGKVRAPHNFADSLDFDFARYVAMQGASGTVYLPRDGWLVASERRLSLKERMLRVRNHLYSTYLYPSFEGDVLGVLSALTLGDRRGVSNRLRAVYSDVGAAHALALSGMHVGIIYFLLAFVLRGVLRRRALRWAGELLIIVMLWLFAFMVGLSASVVRAVAMCTLYALTRWLSDGTSSSLHVLSLTALLMLLVRPLYLFDVGFQLTFMAMVAILWLEPHLEELFCRGRLHPLLSYPTGVVCMSLAAQLGTLPLVVYHFGTFPTYFLVTNLIVVPCLSLVLVLALVWLGMQLVGIPWSGWLGVGLQHLVGGMNGCLAGIGRWPGAVLHIAECNGFTVFFAYLLILFVGLFVVKKWTRGVVYALASLLGLLLSLLWQ